jgi:HEAT repeat protein/beta-lactamase regulating signal transducer with metallopeptidase domain
MNMDWFTEVAATVGSRSLVNGFLGISFKAALVLLGALLVTGLLRRASASTRHQIWAVALVSVLALPALTLALPAWQVPMLPAALAPAGVDTVPSPADASPAMQGSSASPSEASPIGGVPAAEEGRPAGAAPAAEDGRSAGVAPEREQLVDGDPRTSGYRSEGGSAYRSEGGFAGTALAGRDVAGILLAGWALGVAFFLARLGVSAAAAYWLVRGAAPVNDATLLREIRAARRDLGIRSEVRVVCSERVSMPLAWGLLRPAVLLPAESTRWSAPRRRIVLLHEMAHLKRRDCQMLLLGRLVNAFHWFNPLAWTATWRLQAERERACDDLVLSTGTRGADYAEHLLEIARAVKAARTPSWAAVAMARPSELEGRLLAILDPRRRRGRATRAVTGAAALAVGMLVVPLAALQPWAIAEERQIDPSGDPIPGPIGDELEQTVAVPPAPQLDIEVERQPIGRLDPQPGREAPLAGSVAAEGPANGPAAGVPVGHAASAVHGQEVNARVLEAFMTALRDEDAQIRSQAAHALGTIESDQAVAALSEALRNDASAGVRSQAAWALGMIESNEAVAALATAISDENAGVRSQAAWALGMIESDEALAALATAISDENAGVRSQAAWALGMIESDQAVPALASALADEQAQVRSQAAWALGMIESPEAVEALGGVLRNDASAEVRSQAAWALGMIEDETALEALLDALTDESIEVRKQALWAVAQISG